jgi:hypothetical protein
MFILMIDFSWIQKKHNSKKFADLVFSLYFFFCLLSVLYNIKKAALSFNSLLIK